MNDGLIDHNIAASGAGVMIQSFDYTPGTFTMNGGSINYNEAHGQGGTGNGGAVFVSYGIFNLNGGSMRGNTARRYGGAVNINESSIFSINGGCHIYENQANCGGGLSQEAGECSMTIGHPGIIIENNVASNDGGGIFIEKGTLTITDGQIKNNTAGNNGGGIHVRVKRIPGDVEFNMTGGLVQGNRCGLRNQEDAITATDYYRSGGGLCITADYPVGVSESNDVVVNVSTAAIFRNNKANGDYAKFGGGLYINVNTDNSTAEVNVNTGGLFDGNEANLDGGGFYLNNGTVRVNGGKVNNNIAYRNGGGVFVGGSTGSITVSNSAEINNNKANQNGGGFYAGGGTVLVQSNSLVDGNKATDGSGGGFYVAGGHVTVDGCSIGHNSADEDGGGFYVAAVNATDTTFVKGGAQVIYNAAQNGGGAYISKGVLYIKDATTSIAYDTAYVSGGAIYMANGSVYDTQASLTGNISLSSNGGAFYVGDGDITVANASVSNNKAPNGDGGAAYVGSGDVYFTSGTTVTGNAAQNGGGIFIADGDIEYTNAVVSGNAATYFGGGLYVAGDFNFHAGNVKANHAGTQGGGVYITTGGEFTMTGGTIGGALADGNYTTEADSYGGGIYMDGGTATISNSAISGNYTYSRDDLDDLHGCGGAIYMDGGSCTLSNNATIGGTGSGYANISKYGGAIYSADGTITMKGGTIGYNYAEQGGGIYSNGDNAKVYVQKDSSKADVLSYIQYNEAQYGGGIYAQKGIVEFSDGYIQYNHASEQGGGIYVDASDTDADKYGKLYLKGSANLLGNHVPTDHNGGGVYLKGVLTIGEQVTPPAVLGTITANNNFAHTLTGSETAESYAATGVTNETRNNVFLPDPVVDNVHHKDVIEVIFEGIHTDSKIGFSVPANYVPVIYCKNNNIPCTETGYTDYTTSQYFLHQFSTGLPLQSRLFDDTYRYEAVHYIGKEPLFDPNHVYLYGFWSNVVTGDPDDPEYPVNPLTFDPMKISTPAELAYFISWVNGLNGCDEHKSANGKLLADIDMHEYGWVPIGNTGTGYQGVFDGNGHTVSGISSMLNTDHMEYGFIGWLNGGTVKDLYIKGADFNLEYIDGLYIGGVAGKTGGDAVIEGCEAQATITASHPNTVMGGLVGATASGDEISSSIGIADMSGSLMGGLVGQNGGDLFNSFANARFTYKGGDKYYGGLAGENSGTIENCYARLRNTGAMDNTWFGHLVGDNTGGAVKYSYAKATTYTASGKTGTLTEVGYYDNNTMAPYLYGRHDNQVHVEGTNLKYVPSATNPNPNPSLNIPGDQQMLLCLERWVDTMNIKHGGHYAHWSRTTTKAINDDLPILKMPGSYSNAVYCAGNTDGTENEIYLNYGEVNDMLAAQRQAGEAIWLYKSKDNMAGNNGSNAKLYIDEGVTVRQVADLYAYVGVTLDNSANAGGAHPTFPTSQGQYITDYTDWHMFSTPLANAPLGVNYKGDTNPYSSGDFSQPGHPDGMPYYQFYDNEEAASGDEDWERRGYFPSHVYNSTYTDDNTGETTGGNYYREWDFYTYFEPEYHWVNFKRNSNAHYHQNAPDVPIVYTHYDSETGNIVTGNETYLTQGRGYLLATREATFLQCQGLLNGTSGQVSIPVTYSGYYSPGYNFLGNPYLAYLDFDEFARVNKVLWGGGTDTDFTASYAVIDEDQKGYIYRAIRCSANPNTAPQYIAPHQGFMILTHEGIEDDAAAVFYPNMRDLNGDGGHFRGEEQPAYPLVNLIATDNNGNRDIATVELGRPDRGGAPLMRELRQCKGHVWCHYEGKDWAIAFTQPGLTEAAIRFETFEDGEYTMRWNTQNGDFSYLHLIDNLTGADIDCLTTDEYRFASTTMDYKSRFRLVFGYTGIEEPEGDDPAQGSFAYQSGDELVVTGEGTVELFDVTGRRMSAERIEGVQGTMSVSGLTPGVYLLRLATATGTRVQKIVINQ